MLLKTESNVIAELKPGYHVCSFYGPNDNPAELSVQFLLKGLESADKVLYFGDLLNINSLRTYFNDRGMLIDPYLKTQQLTILTGQQVFLKDGSFNAESFLSSFTAQAESYLKQGMSKIWICGETSWLENNLSVVQEFMRFESQLNDFLKKYSFVVLCQFNMNTKHSDLLMHALHTHPFVIIGNELHANIYYMSPDKFLSTAKEKESFNDLLNSIVNRKKSTDLISEKNEESKSLFSNIAIPLFRTDIKDGRVIRCNDALSSYLNFESPQKLIDKKIRLSDYYDSKIRQVLIEYMQKHDNTIKNCELPITKPDGTMGFVLLSGKMYPEKGYLEGNFIDITELKLSEQRNKTILKTAMDGFYIFDGEGTIIEANDAFCGMTGFSQEQLYGMNVHDFDIKIPNSDNLSHLCTAIKSTGSVHFETRYRQKSGSYFDAEITINHVNINRDLFFSFIRDITVRIHNEKKLLNRTRKLEGRVNELQCLFKISDLCDKYGTDLTTILQNIARIIPHAMQYPGITSARIIVKNDEYKSDNYVKTPCIQVSYIRLYGRRAGMIEVCLQFQKDDNTQKSFLKEEKQLLDHIAQRIGRIIERTQAEEELKKYRHQLEDLVHQRTAKLKEEIIKRKKIETALKKNEQKYRAVVEDQTEFIKRFSPDGTLTFVNNALARYINTKPEQLIGQNFIAMLPKDDQKIVKDCIASLTPQNPVKTIEHRYITPDGEEHWLEWTNRKLFDSHGNQIECQAVGRNITERKKILDALQHEKKSIQEYLDVANVILLVINKDLKVSLINKKGCEILGYQSYSEIVGKQWFDHYIPKKDRAVHKKIFNALISKHREKSVRFSEFEYFEGTILTKSGNERTIAWHNTVLHDEKGNIKAILSSGQDITERKIAEKEKEQYQSRLVLSEKMSSIGSLSSGIAHELINVFNVIIKQVESCQKPHTEKDRTAALRTIFDNCINVSRIIKNLLTFTQKGTSPVKCDITELMDIILSLTETHLKKGNIVVKRTYKEPLYAKVNKQEIQQAFLNIIFNAQDAMTPRGGTLTIDAFQKNNIIEIQISDTGKGIDNNLLSKVFDPFFTTKQSQPGKKAQNLGLGLSIVYGIIAKHYGNTRIESSKGNGTTVIINLPADNIKTKNIKHAAK